MHANISIQFNYINVKININVYLGHVHTLLFLLSLFFLLKSKNIN
mgnify:CR=1 FL=1